MSNKKIKRISPKLNEVANIENEILEPEMASNNTEIVTESPVFPKLTEETIKEIETLFQPAESCENYSVGQPEMVYASRKETVKPKIKNSKLFQNSRKFKFVHGKYMIIELKSNYPMSVELWSNAITNSHFNNNLGLNLETYYPKYRFQNKFLNKMVCIYTAPTKSYDKAAEWEDIEDGSATLSDYEFMQEIKKDLPDSLIVTNYSSKATKYKRIQITIKKIKVNNSGDIKQLKINKLNIVKYYIKQLTLKFKKLKFRNGIG